MRDTPESQNRSLRLQCRKLGAQISVAALDLGRVGFVLRWQAFHGVGDAAADKLQTVVRVAHPWLTGKAVAMQRCIEELARKISGKGTPGTVCSVQPGRKAYDQQSAPGIPKGRDGTRMVTGMPDAYAREMRREARTCAAACRKLQRPGR